MRLSVLDDMETAGKKAKYDSNVKLILSNKAVLAVIMKKAIPEYKHESLKDIEGYIHDGIQAGVAAVDANLTDLPSYTSGYRILPLGQESNDMKKGRVTFDVLFVADLPRKKEGKNKSILVDIEPQLKFNPGYPLPKRAVYFLARMISLQKGTVFEGDDYGKLMKCYSIWLCPDTGEKRRSGISFLDLSMSKIFGCLKFGVVPKDDA